MKNLTIFVLTLIALSSVCSLKLNKVLKEEKVLSVTPTLDTDNKVERRNKIETSVNTESNADKNRPRKLETSVNSESSVEEKRRNGGGNKVEAENSAKSNTKQDCINDPTILFNTVDDGSINCVTDCSGVIANIIFDFASLLDRSDLNVFDSTGKKCK